MFAYSSDPFSNFKINIQVAERDFVAVMTLNHSVESSKSFFQHSFIPSDSEFQRTEIAWEPFGPNDLVCLFRQVLLRVIPDLCEVHILYL